MQYPHRIGHTIAVNDLQQFADLLQMPHVVHGAWGLEIGTVCFKYPEQAETALRTLERTQTPVP